MTGSRSTSGGVAVLRILALLGIAVVVGTGCRTARIYQPERATFEGRPGGAARMASAIREGAARASWTIVDSAPGRFVAKWSLEQQVASVVIDYDDTSYRIAYQSSSNLLQSGDQIHKAYNSKVQQLDLSLRRAVESKLPEEQAYARASDDASVSKFLASYPDTYLVPEARGRIDDIVWAKAMGKDSVAAYEGYLRDQPEGRHADKARSRMLELTNQGWEEARRKDTPTAYVDFIQSNPKAEQREEALGRFEEVLWRDAAIADTDDSYASYLDVTGKGLAVGKVDGNWMRAKIVANHADEAQRRLDQRRRELGALDFDSRWMVQQVQGRLRDRGFPKVKSGSWDQATRDALKLFQSRLRLADSGVLDDATKKALGMEVEEEPAANPQGVNNRVITAAPGGGIGILSLNPRRLRSYGVVTARDASSLEITSPVEGKRSFPLNEQTTIKRPSGQPAARSALDVGRKVRIDYLLETPSIGIQMGKQGTSFMPEPDKLRTEAVWVLP